MADQESCLAAKVKIPRAFYTVRSIPRTCWCRETQSSPKQAMNPSKYEKHQLSNPSF